MGALANAVRVLPLMCRDARAQFQQPLLAPWLTMYYAHVFCVGLRLTETECAYYNGIPSSIDFGMHADDLPDLCRAGMQAPLPLDDVDLSSDVPFSNLNVHYLMSTRIAAATAIHCRRRRRRQLQSAASARLFLATKGLVPTDFQSPLGSLLVVPHQNCSSINMTKA